MMRNLCATVLVLAMTATATAEDQSGPQYQNLLTPLQSGGADVLGNPMRYPEGEVDITSAIVTIPPGGTTGLHKHEVPLFAYILEGELTVDYGEGRINTYRVGDTVFEAMDVPHTGVNTGAIPMKLLAVYMGGGGKANTVPLN